MHTGGAERFCVDLCNTLSKEHEVTLCVLDEVFIKGSMLEGISGSVKLITMKKKTGFSIKTVFDVYKYLRSERFDIIHLNGRALIYSSLPIIFTSNKAVYTVHTMADREYGRYIRLYSKLLFRLFFNTFHIVSISKSVKDSVYNVYGIRNSKVIYNGSSSLSNFESLNNLEDDDKTRLIYVGRVSPEKNVVLLIESVRKLIQEGEKIELTIVGDDPTINKSYLPTCMKAASGLENIKFLGRKKNIHKYIIQSDALCLTSKYEGLGIAALEAFACGRPVISTPCGGPEELITPNFNGLISKTHSSLDYTNTLRSFIRNKNYDASFIRKYHSDNYSLDACAQEYIASYNEIITRK